MKDAFGSTFMIQLALVFIVLYVSFLAMAISYTKAFRVKNGVVNIIEQNQIVSNKESDYENDLDDYLKNSSYNYTNLSQKIKENCEGTGAIVIPRGVCIIPKGDNESPYYEVRTYIAIELPLFSINLLIPVKGETSTIKTDYQHIGEE